MQNSKKRVPPSRKGTKHTEETKRKRSKANKGKAPWNTGKKLSKKHREKIGRAIRKRSLMGKRRSDYRGLVPLAKRIYNSVKYDEWRSKVMIRDSFICCECHQIGEKLCAHHIKSFASILDKYKIRTFKEALECKELWSIDIGITLCEKCHKLTKS